MNWQTEVLFEDEVAASGEGETPEESLLKAVKMMLEVNSTDSEFLIECGQLLKELEEADDFPDGGYNKRCGDFSQFWYLKVQLIEE